MLTLETMAAAKVLVTTGADDGGHEAVLALFGIASVGVDGF